MHQKTLRRLQEARVEPVVYVKKLPNQDVTISSPSVNLPAKIRYREGTETKLRANVKRDLHQILANYFGFLAMPFHLKALRDFFAGGKYVKNWPTDHAKSMTGLFWFPILSLMEDPDATHLTCCVTERDATRWVKRVKQALEPNGFCGPNIPNANLLRDYPWIAKPERGNTWTTKELNVAGRSGANSNPSIVATSPDSDDIKGRRGKLMMDDLEGPKHRNSAAERERLFDFIQYEAIRCWEDEHESKRPLQVAMGTPFYMDSVYFRLEQMGWDTDRMPYKKWDCTGGPNYGCDCNGDPDRARENDHGTLVWPAKKDKIEQLRRTYSKEAFAIAMKMDPRGADKSLLTYDEIAALAREGNADPDGQVLNCQRCHGSGKVWMNRNGLYGIDRCPDCGGKQRILEPVTLVCLDPASGSRTRWADYAGITVNRYIWLAEEKLPKIEVVEAHAFNGGLIEQVKSCAHLARYYKCKVLFESSSQQGGNYTDGFGHFAPDIETERWHTSKWDKGDETLGVTALRTILQEKRLLVPAHKQGDEGMMTLFREIRDLGSGEHDHIAMSVWLGMRWTYKNQGVALMQQRATLPVVQRQSQFGWQDGGGNRFGWR